MRHDAAFVPELRALGLPLEERVVDRGRLVGAPAQEQELGLGLTDQEVILAAFQRQLELAPGLVEEALLTEGQPEIVVGKSALGDFGPRRAVADQLVVPGCAVAVERKVRLRLP